MSYTANEQFSSYDGLGSGPRVVPHRIKPKTFAAGTGTLAKLTPVQFNRTTAKYEVWSGLSGAEKTTITSTATGATFTLTVNGETTAAIAYNASAAAVVAALVAVGNINSGDVSATGGALATNPVILTWAGQFKGKAPAVSITDSSTGGTVVIAETVAGVDGGGEVIGFVWPDAVVLAVANEVLGDVMMGGQVDYNDIVLPSGESATTLKNALREGMRAKGFTIDGLDQVH